LFVFSDLTPVSFRCFHALFVFKGLAAFFVSLLSHSAHRASDTEAQSRLTNEKCELARHNF
jgi:hypothetical protein